MQRREFSAALMVFWVASVPWSASPAFADWRSSLAHSFVSPMVKGAALRLIRHELYDVESAAPSRSAKGVSTSGFRSRSTPRSTSASSSGSMFGSMSGSTSSSTFGSGDTPGSASASMPASSSASTSPSTSPSASPSALDEPTEADPSPQRSYSDYFSTADPSAPAVKRAFRAGTAGGYSYQALVKAGALVSYPMTGGTYERKDRVKYIILHSTETGSPADARRVIRSWSNRGIRHPGAQFVVDRDGVIYATTDPARATVHIDTSKTLPGYSNDNSIGIEIVRSGPQRYTSAQLSSVVQLVAYLQDHFQISDANVTTHHHVQPSDRSDPVHFDMTAFFDDKMRLHTHEIASHPQHQPANHLDPGAPLLVLGGSARNHKFLSSQLGLLNRDMPPAAPDFHKSPPMPKVAPSILR